MKFTRTREALRSVYLEWVRRGGSMKRLLQGLLGETAVDPLAGDFPPYHGVGKRRLTVLMDGSNKCNLRCVMCHFALEEVEPIEHYTPVELERLEREILPRARHVLLSVGTEPLMWKGFPELLEVVAKAGVPEVELITNATLITDRTAEAIVAAGVNRVQISVDGGRRETYETIRQGARFEHFLRGVERLNEAKRRAGAVHPELCFNVTLMRSNIEELDVVLELAQRLDVRYLDLRHVVVLPELDMERESLAGHAELANRAVEQACERAAGLGLAVIRRPEPLPILEAEEEPNSPESDDVDVASTENGALPMGAAVEDPGEPDSACRPLPERPACDAPWRQSYVRPDGTVVPCCFWYTEDHMGSLRDASYRDIWNGEPYRRLRRELVQGKLGENCTGCPMAQMGSEQERADYFGTGRV